MIKAFQPCVTIIMVLLQVEIRKAVGERNITPISGQPSTQDILKLEEEIIGIVATILTALRGRNNGSWIWQHTYCSIREFTPLVQ